MKKVLLVLRDIMELHIPVISFVVLFLAFILQVVSRYVFNNPLTWTNDLIVVSFSWLVILGACYTMRKHGHVQFTLLYDLYPPKLAAALRLLGNLLIIVPFALLLVPSVRFAIFQSYQKTAALRINLFWVFIPFAYFLLSIIGYSIKPCLEDIDVLRGKLSDSQDHKEDLAKKPVTVVKKGEKI